MLRVAPLLRIVNSCKLVCLAQNNLPGCLPLLFHSLTKVNNLLSARFNCLRSSVFYVCWFLFKPQTVEVSQHTCCTKVMKKLMSCHEQCKAPFFLYLMQRVLMSYQKHEIYSADQSSFMDIKLHFIHENRHETH